jgi:hypothetical protein
VLAGWRFHDAIVLAVKYRRPALTGPDSVGQPVEHATLGAAAQQLRHASPHSEIRGNRYHTDAIPVGHVG